MEFRIGQGYDVHAIAEGLPMWLGGVQIPSQTGFVAHSDGDVAIHALCDALLGALALGDIGHLCWTVVNADITIALQAPKLAPHIGAMRETLAAVMHVSPARVSVKATTTEHLGFVGRKEGCEVWAIVLIARK